MCQSHTGRLTGLWFLPKPAFGLSTNDDDSSFTTYTYTQQLNTILVHNCQHTSDDLWTLLCFCCSWPPSGDRIELQWILAQLLHLCIYIYILFQYIVVLWNFKSIICHCTRREGIKGILGTALLIFNLGTRWMLVFSLTLHQFYP